MKIRHLNKKINLNVQAIILLVLTFIYLFFTLYNNEASLVFSIQQALVSLLILGAVWLLFKEKFYLASYSVFFLLIFGDAPFSFMRWLLSFDFKAGFTGGFPIKNFIYTIGAVYLGLMILSLLLDEGFDFHKENFYVDALLIAFTILMFLTTTLNTFLLIVLVEFIAINYKKEALLLLMLSKSLTMPFLLINILLTPNTKKFILNVWMLSALSVVVIVLIVLKFISLQNNKNIVEEPNDQGDLIN